MQDAEFERPQWINKIGLAFIILCASFGFMWGYSASAQESSPSVVPLQVQTDKTPFTKSAPPKSTIIDRRLPPTPSEAWRKEFGRHVLEVARVNNLPPNLIMAVIAVESGFNANARNGLSMGLGQVQLATARAYGLGSGNLLDPITNIRIVGNYLGAAYKMAGGNTCVAVSKYNRGLGSSALNRNYCAKIAQVLAYAEFHIE